MGYGMYNMFAVKDEGPGVWIVDNGWVGAYDR